MWTATTGWQTGFILWLGMFNQLQHVRWTLLWWPCLYSRTGKCDENWIWKLQNFLGKVCSPQSHQLQLPVDIIYSHQPTISGVYVSKTNIKNQYQKSKTNIMWSNHHLLDVCTKNQYCWDRWKSEVTDSLSKLNSQMTQKPSSKWEKMIS